MKKIILFLIVLVSTGLTGIHAQDGTLDPSFGTNGIVNVPGSTEQYEWSYALAIQNDGKIVVAGDRNGYSILVKRYNSNGTLDTSFGNQGESVHTIGNLSQSEKVYDVKIQADGKIVVAGSADQLKYMYVTRLNANGTLDTGFGTAGNVTLDIYPNSTSIQEITQKVFVLDDGKIILTGTVGDRTTQEFFFQLASKYNADGTPDITYGEGGLMAITDFGYPASVTCYPDGKIVSLTNNHVNNLHYTVIKRYTQTGVADTSFGVNGETQISAGLDDFYCRDIAIHPNGKIVAGGFGLIMPNAVDFGIVQLNYDGTPDATFGINGVTIQPLFLGYAEVQQIIVQPDGKIVGAGIGHADKNFTLARYNTNGTLDTSFGTNGFIYTSIDNQKTHGMQGIGIQQDGKIVTTGIVYNSAGNNNFIVMRHLGSSTTTGLQEEKATNNFVVYPNPTATTLTLANADNIDIEKLAVIDVTGKILLEQKSNASQIDVQQLPAGMYFLEITANATKQHTKFIKE